MRKAHYGIATECRGAACNDGADYEWGSRRRGPGSTRFKACIHAALLPATPIPCNGPPRKSGVLPTELIPYVISKLT